MAWTPTPRHLVAAALVVLVATHVVVPALDMSAGWVAYGGEAKVVQEWLDSSVLSWVGVLAAAAAAAFLVGTTLAGMRRLTRAPLAAALATVVALLFVLVALVPLALVQLAVADVTADELVRGAPETKRLAGLLAWRTTLLAAGGVVAGIAAAVHGVAGRTVGIFTPWTTAIGGAAIGLWLLASLFMGTAFRIMPELTLVGMLWSVGLLQASAAGVPAREDADTASPV